MTRVESVGVLSEEVYRSKGFITHSTDDLLDKSPPSTEGSLGCSPDCTGLAFAVLGLGGPPPCVEPRLLRWRHVLDRGGGQVVAARPPTKCAVSNPALTSSFSHPTKLLIPGPSPTVKFFQLFEIVTKKKLQMSVSFSRVTPISGTQNTTVLRTWNDSKTFRQL